MNHLFFLCGEKCRRTSYTFLSAAFLLKCVFVFGSFLCRRLIQCIVVKDLSRFGRDYIETGNYLETIFPIR